MNRFQIIILSFEPELDGFFGYGNCLSQAGSFRFHTTSISQIKIIAPLSVSKGLVFMILGLEGLPQWSVLSLSVHDFFDDFRIAFVWSVCTY